MSSINPNRYPVDYTGTAVTNLIKNEVVTLTSRSVRVFVPQSAPFFKKSVVIKDMDTGITLAESQWKAYYLVSAASAMTDIDNDVYAMMAVTDQNVSNNLEITYQTVGGDYVTGFDNVIQMITALTADSRPVTWPNVLNKETGFTPNKHLHPITDTLGWEYIATFLESLKVAILLGDDLARDAVLQYIDTALTSSNAVANTNLSDTSSFGKHVRDTSNPHNVTPAQLALDKVQNYRTATLPEAYLGVANNLYVTTDQVKAVVRDAVNLGMDAHTTRTDNPHNVTPAQVGLPLVLNYSVATASELAAPVEASPKYVTNVVLGQYLTTFFAQQKATTDAAILAVSNTVAAVQQTAQSAQTQALQAQSAAQSAVTQNQAAQDTAAAALTQANTNKQDLTTSVSAVNTLFDTYVAQAVSAGRAAGYSAGYAAGLAAR